MVFLQHVQIIWDAAQNHVGLRDLVTVPAYSFGFDEKFLRLVQPEWSQVNLPRDSSVKAAFVADDFRQHPSCGTSANEKFHAFLRRGPRVPKVSKGLDEVAFGRVHPRQFIKKDHDFPLAKCAQVFTQEAESLKPSLGHRRCLAGLFLDFGGEYRKLHLFGRFVKSGEVKVELLVEKALHEISFPDPSSPVDGHKFRLVGVVQFLDEGLLVISSNYVAIFHGMNFRISLAKIEINSEIGCNTIAKSIKKHILLALQSIIL